MKAESVPDDHGGATAACSEFLENPRAWRRLAPGPCRWMRRRNGLAGLLGLSTEPVGLAFALGSLAAGQVPELLLDQAASFPGGALGLAPRLGRVSLGI